MRYVVFTNTPAHVHLFKHVVDVLQRRGHEVLVLARDYGCTVDLAAAFDLPFRVYGGCETTKTSLLSNLPEQYLRSFYEAVRFDPDVVLGIGAYAAHAGALARARTVLVFDSEPTTFDHRVSEPFVEAMLTPATFRRDLGTKHYVFDGFKESAYLHPDRFDTDSDVRDALGVGDDPYVILRLNAFGSHHDVAHGGFTHEQVRRLVTTLAEDATVLISDESGEFTGDDSPGRPFDLAPHRLHDALAEASLLVADTQTMVTEAALLGTPAIRSNSFVGDDDMGNFIDLADRGLVENLGTFETVRDRAQELLADDQASERWEANRQTLLTEMVDLTELLVDVAENPAGIDQHPDLSRPDTAPETSPEAHT